MATKKFPSELALRGTVLVTDKLLIHNITTGATEYTTVAGLFANPVFSGKAGFGTSTPISKVTINSATDGGIPALGAASGSFTDLVANARGLVAGSQGDPGYGYYMQVQRVDGTATAYNLILQPMGGNVTIGNGASSGNILIGGNCSALSFTDRTPHYTGDAIVEIKKITGRNGLIDHDSLPVCVQVERIEDIFTDKVKTVKGKKVIEKIKTGEETIKERDLGAMISVLTVAIQQLTARIEKLEKK